MSKIDAAGFYYINIEGEPGHALKCILQVFPTLLLYQYLLVNCRRTCYAARAARAPPALVPLCLFWMPHIGKAHARDWDALVRMTGERVAKGMSDEDMQQDLRGNVRRGMCHESKVPKMRCRSALTRRRMACSKAFRTRAARHACTLAQCLDPLYR